MSVINVSGLQKYYGNTHVLRGVDFSVYKGECVILLGANGCGKSTLIRCLNGLVKHDAGDVKINEQSLKGLSGKEMRHIRRRVGVVFQQFNLVKNVSVFQNVLNGAMGGQKFGLLQTLAPLASDELRAQAMACLERVGLEDKAPFKCQQLSGGQQQRVAIARTLMQNADVIIADEPVASLDPKAGREIMDLLIDVVQERKLTVLCSLHQLEFANVYGDRILGMKAGRIQLDEPRSSIDMDTMRQLYQGDVRVDSQEATQVASQQPSSAA